MVGEVLARGVEYAVLADFLGALAYPARLELLDKLRFPHTLAEIRLAPHRQRAGTRPAAAASRQTVWAHLAKLEEADLVRAEDTEDRGRRVRRWVVNSPKLYALTEELRRVSVMHAGRGPAMDATGTLAEPARAQAAKGPRLILVHGVYEGKAFSLDPQRAPAARWTIGRRRGLEVCLDYDPYVSQENSLLAEEAGRYTVTDLRGSKNGTSVNWVRLPRGGSQVLETGDILGVGRSLLSFIGR